MLLAPWRSPLARALNQNRSLVYSRYLQLATVRSEGRPANRTVVFRGFLETGNQLKFVTDRRSEKVEQIRSQPWGEGCWYFPQTREQFRLLGKLRIVEEQEADEMLAMARRSQWQALSNAARVQFAWAHPGQPQGSQGFDVKSPDPLEPLPNFCLLLLEPVQVDHLELRGDPQNRWIYQRQQNTEEETWIAQKVNP